jgi:hypothetical protein
MPNNIETIVLTEQNDEETIKIQEEYNRLNEKCDRVIQKRKVRKQNKQM